MPSPGGDTCFASMYATAVRFRQECFARLTAKPLADRADRADAGQAGYAVDSSAPVRASLRIRWSRSIRRPRALLFVNSS